jgi:oligopeptide transport system substrate-binding protein
MQEYSLPQQDSAGAVKRPDLHQAPALTIGYTQPNWGKAPFNNLLARQAFALALNKSQLIQTVSPFIAFPTNHMIPQGEGDFNPHLLGPDGTQSLTGNLSLAQSDWQQYAATHCPGGRAANCPPVTLAINNAGGANMAVAEQSQWQQVLGVKVKVEALPGPQFYSLISGPIAQQPQLWVIGYSVDFPVGYDWTTLQTYPGSLNNIGNINDSAANRLMINAGSDQSQNGQAAEYQAAEQQLVKDVAWIPLSQSYSIWFSTAKVFGFTISPAGYWLPGNMLETYITA